MRTILINGVGGPTPRSFVIALRNYSRYTMYRFIATDCNKYAMGLYQHHLFNKSYLIPRASNPDYWSAIEDLIEKEKIDYAVVLPEVEALEWSKRVGETSLPCKAI